MMRRACPSIRLRFMQHLRSLPLCAASWKFFCAHVSHQQQKQQQVGGQQCSVARHNHDDTLNAATLMNDPN